MPSLASADESLAAEPLGVEDIRARRLAALDARKDVAAAASAGTTTTNPECSFSEKADDGDLLEALESKEVEGSVDVEALSAELPSVMWDATTTANDVERWYQQGISTHAISTSALSSHRTITDDHLLWGLLQNHGGPCGVLAAVQAEMLRLLFFDSRDRTASVQSIKEVMATAFAVILARSALMPPYQSHNEDDLPTTRQLLEYAAVTLILPKDAKAPAPEHMMVDSTGVSAILLPSNLLSVTIQLVPSDDNNTPQNTSHHCKQFKAPPPSPSTTTNSLFETHREILIAKLADAVLQYFLRETTTPLNTFHNEGGVMLLVMSLICSRGVDRIRNDMDDPTGTRLTSQFGHSSQELINLLLTGQAVSNVFDNTLFLEGGLACRGIQCQPCVGYLSQLESLRYCEVGGYYKSPKFPVWVVGSTSHFSVLFGENDASCLKESSGDVLLEKCRRAFKGVQGGEENGFIAADQLIFVINKLDLLDKVGGEEGVQTLAAALEVSDAGIILWDDFWKASSRLLSGATLQSVLQMDTSLEVDDRKEKEMPMLLTQFGEGGGRCDSSSVAATTGGSSTSVATPAFNSEALTSSAMESDEDLAKRLAAEWGSDNLVFNGGFGDVDTNDHTPSHGGDGDVLNVAKSDEELARELQAQWDAEATNIGTFNDTSSLGVESQSNMSLLSSVFSSSGNKVNEKSVSDGNYAADDDAAAIPGPSIHFSMDETTGDFNNEDVHSFADTTSNVLTNVVEDTKISAKVPPRLDFEKFGYSFQMYHYNGLRGGCLTPFLVTRLSPEDAVGTSIALSSTNATGIASPTGTGIGNSGRGGGDLEDVVRTKWPSCIFNWGENSPPYID